MARPDEGDFDLYDALNVSRDASTDDVRGAFRELSRIYHPDKQAATSGNATGDGGDAAFMRIHRAYRVLSDEQLRSFYDRYGLSGVRLAESLSDEENDANDNAVSLPDDRLGHLETRVRRLLQKHEELRAQRLLGVNGSFTLGALLAAREGSTHRFARRWRFQYSAVSQSVQVALGGRCKMTLGCAMHVQGANGAGVSKFSVGGSCPLGSATSIRGSLSTSGTSRPDVDLTIIRALSPHCLIQSKLGWLQDGPAFNCTVQPWLSRSLRATAGMSLGSDSWLSLGLLRRSFSGGNSLGLSLRMQPRRGGELSMFAKVKPVAGVSVKAMPTVSAQGCAVELICSKALADGLTKVKWILRVRRNGLALKLTFARAGLRFTFPLELWPEAAGPVPAAEYCSVLLLWALPPLLARAVYSGYDIIRNIWFGSKQRSVKAVGTDADSWRPSASATSSQQRRMVQRDADRRRTHEEAAGGLEVLCARYGDAAVIDNEGATSREVIDVTACLMAKVRDSRLEIGAAPKSSLIGFCDPRSDASRPPPRLYIRFRYGGVEYSRTFSDTEAVVLP
eukprot:TRINITY_DN50064_c0_g1_i1.p1 TRINITY_DN50064_c0_g1~~TRINITY_DN50064_c0_g1_i1.p1  ORF type:complete len:563 (+),score=59.28 TRINITY_DN50064_c0_g1_i1:89-1777(+)